MLNTIKDLREIARCCVEGRPLNEELAQWLAKSLAEFLTHRAPSIEDALGLRSPRGGVPWWREEAMRIRNDVLRRLGDTYYFSDSVSRRARRIYLAAIRYGASTWQFDRKEDMLPPGYAGTPKEYLWRAFKSGAPMPVGERQLRTILAQNPAAAPGCR